MHDAGHRWRHSLRKRLVVLFVLLALSMAGAFMFGTQRLVASGWQGWARPLVADYLDRLAAEIGSPPSVERAQAITARLPVTVRIDGPVVHFDSHPGSPSLRYWHDRNLEDMGWGLVRQTADGHRIAFGLASLPDPVRPRMVGLLTLATLLLLTGVAYAVVNRLLRPLVQIGAGAARYEIGRAHV